MQTLGRAGSGSSSSVFGEGEKDGAKFHDYPPAREVQLASHENDSFLAFDDRRERLNQKKRLTLFTGWPLFIVCGQLLVLAFAWGFFGAVLARGKIALPDRTAERIARSPRTMTLIVTLIATALSLFTTFLFTRAIRFALTSRLHRPISLRELAGAIELSKGTAVLNVADPKWTTLTLICVAALSTLTAGWVTLLNPTPITVERSISGVELNMATDAFVKYMMHADDDLPSDSTTGSPAQDGTSSSAVMPLMESSGKSAANRRFNLPSIFTYDGASYNYSTGGTIAMDPLRSNMEGSILNSSAIGLDYISGTSPKRTFVDGSYPHPSGFQRNFTLYQQGTTANVSCSSRDLSISSGNNVTLANVGSNPISYSAIFPGYTDKNNSQTLQVTMWNSSCTPDTFTPESVITYQDENSGDENAEFGQVGGTLCPNQNLTSTESYTGSMVLALVGQNFSYSFIGPTICEITPVVATMQVDYGTLVTVSKVTDYVPVPDTPMNDGGDVSDEDFYMPWPMWFGSMIYEDVFRMVLRRQLLAGNSFGDAVASLYYTQPQSVNGTDQEKTDLLNGILEDYLKGVVEASGTHLRAGFQAKGYFANDQIPSNMSSSVTGTLYAQTYGWKSDVVGLLNLATTTFIALTSVLAVLVSLGRQEIWITEPDHDGSTGRSVPFNPSNPLHLIIASSSGTLGGGVGGFQENEMSRNERIRVRLGRTERSKIGLITDG